MLFLAGGRLHCVTPGRSWRGFARDWLTDFRLLKHDKTHAVQFTTGSPTRFLCTLAQSAEWHAQHYITTKI